jgi:signal peptidase
MMEVRNAGKIKRIPAILLVLSMHVFLNLAKPAGLMAYILPIVCWSLAALIILYLCGFENLSAWFNKSITLIAALIATLQISALITAAFFTSFGKSPYTHALTAIPLYIAYFTARLLAFELSRAYIIKSYPRKRIFAGTVLTALFYTFLKFPVAKLLSLGEPAATAKFIGSEFLPTLAQSLFATYLALLGGPEASLAYMGIPEAFEWLSPILPNPAWAIKALITTIVPVMGFYTLNQAINPFTLARYGIIERIEARKPLKTGKSLSLSWIAVALTAVILVWGSTGLLGFQPTIIASGSMQPALNVGDIAITVPTPPEKIRIGDIIQYWRTGDQAPTIHRVIEINRIGKTIYIITKGDANKAPDEPIQATASLGKVVFTIPKLGWVSIHLKVAAATAYTFLTVTLPKALTKGATLILANTISITAALTLTAYAYLLFTYHKATKRKKGK